MIQSVPEQTQEAPGAEPFSKSFAAAKLSGRYNETAGFIKRKLGSLTADPALEIAGEEQQLLGKAHRLVGSLRGARKAILAKVDQTRAESLVVCREHGGRLLDGASEFVDAIVKALLK